MSGDDIFELLRKGYGLIENETPVMILLWVFGVIVLLFTVSCLVQDLCKLVSDWFFWRWLGKDGNFIRFRTEDEAREGYEHYISAKRYWNKTRHFRKKLARQGGTEPSFHDMAYKNPIPAAFHADNPETPKTAVPESEWQKCRTLKEKYGYIKDRFDDFCDWLDSIPLPDISFDRTKKTLTLKKRGKPNEKNIVAAVDPVFPDSKPMPVNHPGEQSGRD